jgi:hypothetical protein
MYIYIYLYIYMINTYIYQYICIFIGEIMFWDSSNGEPQIPKMVKELKWSTNTCIYSYATQGFYGPYDDKVELIFACRSNGR